MATRKIVCIGAESTGKSTLVLELAKHFNAPCAPEFARGFLEDGCQVSGPETLVYLAKQQIAAEKQAESQSKNGWVFCDTDLHNMVVWSLQSFGQVDPELERLEKAQRYNFYLLLAPDIPWQKDELRKNANLREELHETYKQHLVKRSRPFQEITGFGKCRLQVALQSCQSLL